MGGQAGRKRDRNVIGGGQERNDNEVEGGGRSEQGADKSPNAVPIVKAERSNTWEHSVLFVLPPVKDQRPGAFEPEEGRLWVVRA